MNTNKITAKIEVSLPHKCTDKTSSRYALANVLCTPKADGAGVFLASTDGRCLAVSEMAGTASEQCSVPGALLDEVGSNPITITTAEGTDEWQCRVGAKITVATPAEGRFPRIEEILSSIEPKETDEGVFHATHEFITLSADLLMRIAQTISSDDQVCSSKLPVTIAIPHDKCGSIKIIGNRGIGIQMPIGKAGNQAGLEAEHAQQAKRYEEFRKAYAEAKTAEEVAA